MQEAPAASPGIAAEIREILFDYVAVKSITNTPGERDAADFFLNFFRSQPYWRKHPELCGSWDVPGDPGQPELAYAMVRGGGEDTIVFVHHSDVVTVEDFKRLEDLAFSPEELEKALWGLRGSLPEEARDDLESGGWLYGRGVCDMKGGGAIQMALLRRYSRQPERLRGNVIVLAVPDEENLSAGMRAAAPLLLELQKRFGLRYRLMVDSEPHQRREAGTGIFSVGSVGKLLPFVYVRGSLAHAGKVFEGFDPLHLMGEIVTRTELNMELADTVAGEVAPPPVWLYLRDRKIQYDVSMPLSAAGCLSVLTLKRKPTELLEDIRRLCEESFEAVLQRMEISYRHYLSASGQPAAALPWKSQVSSFSELYQEALALSGVEFYRAYAARLARLKEMYNAGEATLLECNFQLLDYVYGFVDDLSPRVVFGLIPPYYPSVSNCTDPALPADIAALPRELSDFTLREFGQPYEVENFYTGISDLSYTSLSDGRGTERCLRENMPLYGTIYELPLREMESVSMPCINIGPWGKDFHKLTERVFKQDLYERTPRILHHVVETILQHKNK